MQSFNVKLISIIVLCILPACANLNAANNVKEIHGYALCSNSESELAIENSLMDTYSKSGNIIYSKALFNEMSTKDIITQNTIIAGYGQTKKVDEGKRLFSSMPEYYHVLPYLDHYAAMVNLLGYSEKLAKAFKFIKIWPWNLMSHLVCLSNCVLYPQKLLEVELEKP